MTIIRDGTAASFIVVWKNGKWKQTAKPGKYEQEADFLVTIPIRETVPDVPTSGSGNNQ